MTQSTKRRFGGLAAALTILMSMAGCANNQQLGTGVGAVAGGVVGDAVFGSTLGTVGGAAAGAVIGNQIGKSQDRR